MFDQLKPLIRSGERYVIVEDGKPEYVFMRFADYAALAGGARPGYHRNPVEAAVVNAELDAAQLREQAFSPEFASGPEAHVAADQTIRLEDLPL